MHYYAIAERGPGGGWFLTLPGGAGYSFAETAEQIVEQAQDWLTSAAMDGGQLPRSIEDGATPPTDLSEFEQPTMIVVIPFGKGSSMTREAFVPSEERAHAAFFARSVAPNAILEGFDHRLKPKCWELNLAPAIRDLASGYFRPAGEIVPHQYISHGLSSQACCLNFLMPLATQPRLLEQVIGSALGLHRVEVLAFDPDPSREPQYVEFEWIGKNNYLSEWPSEEAPPRGANVTSADAAVRFTHDGVIHAAIIEWKYTEKCGPPLRPAGNPTRIARYTDKMIAPNGPIRSDAGVTLENFFWEPLYQLLRQQMLAWRMERAKENGAERVLVLHISPAANTALHKVTSPTLRQLGDDVFEVFRSLLVEPDRFIVRSTEQVFGPFLHLDHADRAARHWAAYLRDRYRFLSAPGNRKD